MSKRGTQAKQRRRELDRLFETIRGINLTPPRKGWIADIRSSLGMMGVDLARRLQITSASLHDLEESEATRRITISSLDKVAEALGCHVVYALVPNEPLEDQLRTRATEIARRLRAPVAHSMALEDQATDPQAVEDQDSILADELIEKLDRALWDPEG